MYSTRTTTKKEEQEKHLPDRYVILVVFVLFCFVFVCLRFIPR